MHNIANLTCNTESQQQQSLAKAVRSSGKVDSAAQYVSDLTDKSEEFNASTSFVNIVLNDQTIMISRVKALKSATFFQAGVERFIRNWRRSYV